MKPEWPIGPCPLFGSADVASQRRDAEGRWVHEETPVHWCRHERSPVTQRDAVCGAGALLRCDGFLERCEVPADRPADPGQP